MDIEKMKEFCSVNNIKYVSDAPLKDHCTFKIGGNVSLAVWPNSNRQIEQALLIAQTQRAPIMILGKGSNSLFSDNGFDGMLLVLGENFSDMKVLDNNIIECESGASLSKLCQFAMENSLTGLEFAYGIPGSVGGAVYMNAGAYNGEIKDVVKKAYYLSMNGSESYYENAHLDFGYRHSAFTDKALIITKSHFYLQPGNKDEINAKMEDFFSRRKAKQPLEYPSAGSVFRRPVGSYASALIDQCGLKGKSVGGAAVSTKHAGFIINTGDATCEDVQNLIKIIQTEVLEKTGFTLECEIKTMC